MAAICAHCGSDLVLHEGHLFRCQSCGAYTDYEGNLSVPDSALAADAAPVDFPTGDYTKATTGSVATPPAPEPDVAPADEPVPEEAPA